MRAGRSSGMESKKGRRREEWRISQEKRPEGSTRRRKLVREERTQRLSKRCYTIAKPSAVAKPAGTPNSLIVTWPEASERTLRARRAVHERRERPSCARTRMTSAVHGEAV